MVRLIELESPRWSPQGDLPPFGVTHAMVDDERLTMDAITALAQKLPDDAIETTSGALPLVYGLDAAPAIEARTTEALAQIASGRGWMAIKHIEREPRYRRLVEQVIGEAVARLGAQSVRGVREGYLFVSSGGSTTPAHVDHEHNLLLQIRGTKRVTVGAFPGPAEEAAVMEGMHSGAYGRTGFLPRDPITFELEPGKGVFIPPRSVHLVECGEELSISLSLVFHTAELERSTRVYACNARLRRFGLSPRPPQASRVIDRLKSGAVLVAERIPRTRHRS